MGREIWKDDRKRKKGELTRASRERGGEMRNGKNKNTAEVIQLGGQKEKTEDKDQQGGKTILMGKKRKLGQEERERGGGVSKK